MKIRKDVSASIGKIISENGLGDNIYNILYNYDENKNLMNYYKNYLN
jgi:glycogen synthase